MEAHLLSQNLKVLSIRFDYLYCRLYAIIYSNLFNMLKSFMLNKMTTLVMISDNKCQCVLLTRENMDGSINQYTP